MDESGITQNRRSGRSPVLLSAKVDVNGREVSVVLRNLSSEGALIEGADTVPGRIVWIEGRFGGLAFDRRLDREELLRQVPQPRQRIEPQFRRPGLACRPLSDADRKWLQVWATSATAFGD